MTPTITRIETTEFNYTLEDIGPSSDGFHLIYDPGNTIERLRYAIRIQTDTGITGEYVGGSSPAYAQINQVADYMIGENPLHREKIWSDLSRALRKYDWMGIGPIDIALWDFVGKYHDVPIHTILGIYRNRLPTYASTYGGDRNGGLDSPEAYADFAERCLEMGYGGFKIHDWRGNEVDTDRTIATVHEVGQRVGDEMDLMLDPACVHTTFMDALKIGRACDDAEYFWYEDPYRNAGISQHSHQKLREELETPLLVGEHIRGLESHTDVVSQESTDFIRADPDYDGGITGVMKIARMAEGLGIDVELHGPGPAQRQCIAAIRNTNYYEMALVHPHCHNTTPPIYADGYEDQLTSIDEDGTVPVPTSPGLGVNYDWEYITENRTGGRVYE